MRVSAGDLWALEMPAAKALSLTVIDILTTRLQTGFFRLSIGGLFQGRELGPLARQSTVRDVSRPRSPSALTVPQGLQAEVAYVATNDSPFQAT
jgi:hypothetical protein